MTPLAWLILLAAAMAWPLVVVLRDELSDEDWDNRWDDVEDLFR